MDPSQMELCVQTENALRYEHGRQWEKTIEINEKIQSKLNNYVQLYSEIHPVECVSNVFVLTGKPGKTNKQTIHSHTDIHRKS